jgi:adenylate cyclase
MSDVKAITILFADISGSTRLFETRGDVEARALCSAVLGALSSITKRNSGGVVKTIGDEIMCTFPQPKDALFAAVEMQKRVSSDLNWARDHIGIRVGLHHGEALLEADGDVYGDAVNTAARMAQLAKREQIVTTSSTVAAVSNAGSFRIRSLGEALVKGKLLPVEIVDLLWQEDTSNVTMVTTLPDWKQLLAQKLVMRARESVMEMIESSQPFGLGREPSNQCIVDNEWVSRNHATIEFQRGQFLITDRSTNGTYVKIGDDDEIRLHRDSMPLRKSGSISLGQSAEKDPASVVSFQCSP